MSTKIENLGTYRGKITSAAMAFTKNKYPQTMMFLSATEKWVDSPHEMEHFEITEPAWIDWSEFDEVISAYLVLYNPQTTEEPLTEDNMLLNCKQLQLATGWDGTSFNALNDGTYHGKSILFQVEDNTYNGETKPQVSWIDHVDASPTRELTALAADKLAALNARLQGKPATHTKPAKPVTAAATKKVKATKKTAVKKTLPAAAPETTEGCTIDEAWQYLVDHKGDLPEDDLTQPWIDARDKVGPNLTDDDFTGAQWAEVRDSVVKTLSLTV